MGYIKKLRSLVGNMPLILNSAGVLLFKDQKVLLIYRKDTNDWGIPGGYMEVGETFEETVVRELREELNITVKNLSFFDLFSGSDFFHTYPNGDQVYSIISMFTADQYEGEIRVDHQEIASYQYFDLGALPDKITKTSSEILKVYRNSL